MVTRNDVAKRANVSTAVVSYVINNSNYVSDEKRDAVLQAMKELHYIPNQTARSLARNKTYQIAIVRGSVLNDMFNDLLFNMETLAYKRGYTIYSITVMHDKKMIALDSFIDDLISRRFDAIFIANSSLLESQINRLASYGIAVLLYNTRDYVGLDERIRCLAPDYRSGVQQLIEMLIDNGHTKIGFFPNTFYPYVEDRTNHRFDGYIRAFEARSLPVNPAYIGRLFYTIDETLDNVTEFFNPSHVAEPPTALYVDESVVAGSILKRLQEMGLRVPEDVSLVNSSDSTISRILTPCLTSVGIDPQLLAAKAMDMMVELMNGGCPESCKMKMNLYIRESVKCIR